MKKTFKLLFFGSLPLFLLIIIISFIDILKTDFKYAHQSLYTYHNPFNWFSYRVKSNITKSLITFKKNTVIGLPIKHIYIQEQLQKELLKNTPGSTKKWKKGLLLNRDGSTEKIELRLKGDQPANWLFLKKHWKVKKRKKDLTERQRYFEYLPFDFEIYFSGKIANSLKLISPKFKLVELFINDESQGVYIETEVLNEGFLRRNRIMPVNLYKGELILSESILDLEMNLLNSPGGLKKIAYFNQVKKDDKSDLKFLSSTIQLAHNNEISYSTLMELIDLDYWSKFLSYQILTQNFHNDYSHNFRMISDPWSGKFTPIVYDPLMNIDNEKNIDFDRSSNELFVLLNQNSYFQNLKFKHLNSILNSNFIENELIDTNLLDEQIKVSEARDIELLTNNFNLYSLFSKMFDVKSKSNIFFENKKQFIKKFKIHKENVKNSLNKKPEAGWYKTKNGFEIYVNGILPISDLKFFFNNEQTKWVALDINENGIVDKNEIKFKLDRNNYITIPYELYANRIPYADKLNDLAKPKLKILPTRFKFISESAIKPERINFKNPFLKKEFELKYKKQSAFAAKKYNKPVAIKNMQKSVILEGVISVDKTKVYKDFVEIKPGTQFFIKNGSSIIFKDKLIALGTKEKPILFKKSSNQSWGTIALQGNKSKNSIINNVVFDGGSGSQYRNIKYTGALSIHDTENIIIKNVILKNNSEYDDMLHIIYVDNIKLENLYIENSNMDAIDIDMSKNIEIKNILIEKSGNDGIDLMESDAVITNIKVYNSKDKAISVGENSFLVLNKSTLSKNEIGIATKDRSFSFVANSNLINNNISLNNYKKNLQYADGGVSLIYKTNLENKKNTLVDKNSTIKIINSKVNGNNIKEKLISNKINKNHITILKKNNSKEMIKILKKY